MILVLTQDLKQQENDKKYKGAIRFKRKNKNLWDFLVLDFALYSVFKNDLKKWIEKLIQKLKC